MSTSQSDFSKDKTPQPVVCTIVDKKINVLEDGEKPKNTISNKPSLGEVKFLVQSHLQPDNSTGSFDQSFEYKPILCDKKIINDNKNVNNKKSVNMCDKESYCDLITDKMTDSRIAYFNIGNECNTNVIDFKPKLPSSTPVSKPCEYKPIQNSGLNLLVPPSDAGFIDSDFESMENDRYSNGSIASDTSSNENIVIESNNRTDQDNIEPKIAVTKKEDRYIPTPVLAKNNTKLIRNANILNLFTTQRRNKYRNDKIRRCLNKEDGKENGSLSAFKNCVRLALTKENLDRYLDNDSSFKSKNYNTEWGENFDFSFQCEPSTSDNEDNISNDSSAKVSTPSTLNPKEYRKCRIIPTFKIDPPPAVTPSTTPSSPLLPHLNVSARGVYSIVTRSLDLKPEQISVLRRSMSDPDYLMQHHQVSSSTPSDDNDSDCDTFETALCPNETQINCANVKNLETITVSK